MSRKSGRNLRGRPYQITRRDYKNLIEEKGKKSYVARIFEYIRSLFAKAKKQPTNEVGHYAGVSFKRTPVRRPGAYISEEQKPSLWEYVRVCVGFVGKIFLGLLSPIIVLGQSFQKKFKIHLRKTDFFRAAFTCAFLIIALKFADLQVISNTNLFKAQSKSPNFEPSVILAKRGQINIKDLSQNKNNIPVTSSHILSNVFFEPNKLALQINSGDITLEEASRLVSGGLNLEYKKVYNNFKRELDRQPVRDYAVLEKYITKSQRDAVEYLRRPNRDPENEDLFVQPALSSWLGHDTAEIRIYPENELLASTLGFVPRYLAPRDDALQSGCANLVTQNEERGTGYNGYVIGNYGLEQKYCSELGGINGLTLFSQDVGTETEDALRVQNGADLYLTIDVNIQRKAEEVLSKAVKAATNKLGGPKDGSAIVMEAETGKILAMASYPTFNPNEYNKANPDAFRNASSNIDYEVGSVMKPLTVAATVNEWQVGALDENGERLGTAPDWSFEDYDEDGKVYTDNNGTEFKIQNADGKSYKGEGELDLSQILRDSVNTGIAEIIPTIGNEGLKKYFLEKFKVGVPTYLNLPGDSHGYYAALTDDKNLYSDFVYATFGFGQGFTMSPIQLLRAYTPLANDGIMVEPYLVEQALGPEGQELELPPKPEPEQILTPTTARLVTGYLVNTIDQGHNGEKPSKGQVPQYSVAGKTGTAEVGRKPANPCGEQVNIYACNRGQGIYDHTYVGYGPEKDSKYIVLLKLTEPQPGVVQNYAENTTGPFFSELMDFTLQYNKIETDRKAP